MKKIIDRVIFFAIISATVYSAYVAVPTRSSTNVNSSADINQLQANVVAVNDGVGPVPGTNWTNRIKSLISTGTYTNYAFSAGYATNAGFATNAGYAYNAAYAATAGVATYATYAALCSNASNFGGQLPAYYTNLIHDGDSLSLLTNGSRAMAGPFNMGGQKISNVLSIFGAAEISGGCIVFGVPDVYIDGGGTIRVGVTNAANILIGNTAGIGGINFQGGTVTIGGGNMVEINNLPTASNNAARLYEVWQATNITRLILAESDFYNVSSTACAPYLVGNATLSGATSPGTGLSNRPGIANIIDSTTANGSYRFQNTTTSYLIRGGERASCAFYSRSGMSGVGRTNCLVRFGFFDNTGIADYPDDGVYFLITNRVTDGVVELWGVVNSNSSTPTFTSTSNELSTNDVCYLMKLQISTDGNTCMFYLLNGDTGAQIWSNSIVGVTPRVPGLETGFGVMAGEGTTSAADNIIGLDYLKIDMPKPTRFIE